MVSQMSTGFMESRIVDDAGGARQLANIELSGQLVGDVGATLQRLDAQLGQARVQAALGDDVAAVATYRAVVAAVTAVRLALPGPPRAADIGGVRFEVVPLEEET